MHLEYTLVFVGLEPLSDILCQWLKVQRCSTALMVQPLMTLSFSCCHTSVSRCVERSQKFPHRSIHSR
jgi:hypothetical protein